MKHAENPKRPSKFDIAACVLSALLLVTLALAASYGMRYGNVDESSAVGSISIYKGKNARLIVGIDENMNGKVRYMNHTMKGTFVLAGAEEDSVLYQLKNIEFTNKKKTPSDAVLFVRMPRSGLQGDFIGPWMVYFSCPSKNIQQSDWFITYEDGIADVGTKEKANAITAQRFNLVAQSKNWVWHKSGHGLYLEKE